MTSGLQVIHAFTQNVSGTCLSVVLIFLKDPCAAIHGKVHASVPGAFTPGGSLGGYGNIYRGRLSEKR